MNDLVEAIAERTAEIVLERLGHRPVAGMVDAAELADTLGVARSYVYEHAEDLGAVRLGDGPKARLRFDVATATARYAGKPSQAAPAPVDAEDSSSRSRRRRRRLPNGLPETGSVLAVRPRVAATEGGGSCR